MAGIVIVGAGQAGAEVAVKLRNLGCTAPVTIIGEEPAPPYQRPPLSKGYLMGEMELERLYLRAASFWPDHDITLRLGTRLTAIDRAAKTVTAGGETIAYDQLVLTTGSRPRLLPEAMGAGFGNVFTVRTLEDVDRMAPAFQEGRRLIVIGGGYIGLEAAAVAAKLGLKVTLVEAAPRILQRVAAPETSAYFRNLHERHGVTVMEGTGIDRLLGNGDVTGVLLADGRELPADVVVVGIGILPNTDLAEAAGLAVDNGIRTDEQGRTSDPSIWAAGDCASFPYQGGRIRLESVGNAIDQAHLVAENIMGAAKPYDAKPWFWSDQYETKLQIAGLGTGYDHIVTRQGEGDTVSFWYYKGPKLLAVDAMNDGRAYMIGKRLIEMGKSPDPAVIADAATDLKPLLKA
jgi:3-phenylpropionate/trans-cinnamate dioxygenase ferredoxin reductase component